MRKYGPYDGTLVVGDIKTQEPCDYVDSLLRHIYLKLAKPKVRLVELFNKQGARIGWSQMPVKKFSADFGSKNTFDVKYETVGPGGSFGFFDPSMPEHRIMDVDSEREIFVTSKPLALPAYNAVFV